MENKKMMYQRIGEYLVQLEQCRIEENRIRVLIAWFDQMVKFPYHDENEYDYEGWIWEGYAIEEGVFNSPLWAIYNEGFEEEVNG